jgi:hypothetical protein
MGTVLYWYKDNFDLGVACGQWKWERLVLQGQRERER